MIISRPVTHHLPCGPSPPNTPMASPTLLLILFTHHPLNHLCTQKVPNQDP